MRQVFDAARQATAIHRAVLKLLIVTSFMLRSTTG